MPVGERRPAVVRRLPAAVRPGAVGGSVPAQCHSHLRTETVRPDPNTPERGLFFAVLTAGSSRDFRSVAAAREPPCARHQLYTRVHDDVARLGPMSIRAAAGNLPADHRGSGTSTRRICGTPGPGRHRIGRQANRPHRPARRPREGYAPHRCRLRMGGPADVPLRHLRPHRTGLTLSPTQRATPRSGSPAAHRREDRVSPLGGLHAPGAGGCDLHRRGESVHFFNSAGSSPSATTGSSPAA